MHRKITVYKGDKFNHLTVIEEVAPTRTPNGTIRRMIKCQCDCGKETTLPLFRLVNKTNPTQSCGCIVGGKKIYTDEELLEHKVASNRRYYEANKERLAKYSKAYAESHKEQIKRRKAEWYQENRARIRQKQKEYSMKG